MLRTEWTLFRDGLEAALSGDVAHTVTTYMCSQETVFDGRHFETYGSNADGVHRIEPADLVAVTMLSMSIQRVTTSGITTAAAVELERRAEAISALLAQIPDDRDLHSLDGHEFERWLGSGSPGNDLYWMLRTDIGMARVATNKLLARKRPRLFPVRDSVVERAIGWRGDEWWEPWWWSLTSGTGIVTRLEGIRTESGQESLSLLRVADIAVWMTYRSRSTSDDHDDEESS